MKHSTHTLSPLMHVWLFAALALFASFVPASARLVGAFVLPHGGIALDPSHFQGNATQRADARKVHLACVEVGQAIESTLPELVVLISPHAVALDSDFGIVLNENGSGDATTEGNYRGFELTANMSSKHAKKLVRALKSAGERASGITAFAASEPYPLRWGEVIPLWFFRTTLPPIVLWTQPTRRYNSSVEMIPELLRVGAELARWAEELKERVILIVSGDLAHTHLASGPYGYSPAAAPFDHACGEWVLGNADALLVRAAGLVDEALSCGFPGFVMLQGALVTRTTSPIGTLWVNAAPSYYGMLVASWELL